MLVTTMNIGLAYEVVGCFAGAYSDGLHAGKDFVARIKEFVGGRVTVYDRTIARVTEKAVEDMAQKAAEAGCDALIGVRHQMVLQSIGKGSTVFISTIGTGVRLKTAPGADLNQQESAKSIIQKLPLNTKLTLEELSD